MREIVNGILTWSWFSEPHGYNFNGHLIRDPGGNICVDPVEPTKGYLDAIVREGVTWILLTNRNHSRAANRVRARTGARTAIHADDADHARSQDTEIDDALTVGDAIIGNPAGACGLLPERVIDDPARFRESVRNFLHLDFDTHPVGDGVAINGDAKVRLAELIETFAAATGYSDRRRS